jgi:class 3 adenylate cyclase/TolB-like protein
MAASIDRAQTLRLDSAVSRAREPGLEASVRMVRRLAAIAFADVAGWSGLVEMNELEAVRAWNALRTGFIEPKIREHAGRLVDLAGDAVFVEFPSAVDAVRWAIELQRQPATAGAAVSARRLKLRIGINVCDVLVDEGRLAGDGVNIAARIHQVAAPGDIVVTEMVREHVHQRIPVGFRDLGERQLKNINRPIRIYRVEAEGLQVRESIDAAGTERALRALLALDVRPSGSPPARGANDAAWRRLKDHVAQEVLPASGGRVVWQHDSGLLLDFAEARSAVNAAFAIQRACSNGSAGLSLERHILPRMGLQMGEALTDQTDLYGSGASVATRLTAIAGPGGIVASSTVRDGLTSVLDADIEDLGECYLHEMNQPVRAYRLEPPGTRQPIEPGGAADELRPTIAVIPFAERGDGHETLGEILAEDVIAALSRSAELNVVSRLSTTAFRGRSTSLGELSAHLKADYVLCGAYRVAAGSLILAAELAETKSGRVAWAKDFKGSVAGIIEGKGELIDRLVGEAGCAIMARELERTRSQSLQSLQSLQTCTLLIGAIALMHRLSPSDFDRARDMLLAVAQRVPRHAIPLAWLAKWHVLRVWKTGPKTPRPIRAWRWISANAHSTTTRIARSHWPSTALRTPTC